MRGMTRSLNGQASVQPHRFHGDGRLHGFIATRSDSLTTTTTRIAAPSKVAAIKKGSRAANESLSALRSVIFCHGVPVHHVPPCFDVIGPAVLVFEIIGVLPNVDAKNGRVAVHQRVVLIWC